MSLTAFGVALVAVGVYGIVFRSGYARFYRGFNRALLGIDQSLMYHKILTATLGVVSVVAGLAFTSSASYIGALRDNLSATDKLALAIIAAGGSIAQAIIIVVTKRRWAQFALEEGDAFLGVQLRDRNYRTIAMICFAISAAAAILGIAELVQLAQ